MDDYVYINKTSNQIELEMFISSEPQIDSTKKDERLISTTGVKKDSFLIKKLTDVVQGVLNNIENLILKENSKKDIEAYVLKTTGKELRNVTSLSELDAIASSYISHSNLMATLDGLIGVGGVFFITIEIPILLGIICQLLTQLAWIYGVECTNENHDIILHLLTGSIREEIDEFNIELVQVKSEIDLMKQEYTTLQTSILGGVIHEIIKDVSYQIGYYFSSVKLLQMIPIFGVIAGVGINYYYITDTAKFAIKELRKDWIIRKVGLNEYLKAMKQKKYDTHIILPSDLKQVTLLPSDLKEPVVKTNKMKKTRTRKTS